MLILSILVICLVGCSSNEAKNESETVETKEELIIETTQVETAQNDTDIAIIWQLPDGSVQIGGTPKEGWVNIGDSSMVGSIPSQVETSAQESSNNGNGTNVNTRKIYEQKTSEGYQCKIDPDGSCWVVSIVSDFMPRMYDVTIYTKYDEETKYSCSGFHKEGSMTYVLEGCNKNGQQISQSDYERIMDNFEMLQDCY